MLDCLGIPTRTHVHGTGNVGCFVHKIECYTYDVSLLCCAALEFLGKRLGGYRFASRPRIVRGGIGCLQ